MVYPRRTRLTDSSDTDPRFVISHVAESIANADLKAGLVTAAQIVAIGVVAGQRSRIAGELSLNSLLDAFSTVTIVVTAVAFAVSVVDAARAVFPRTSTAPGNRFSWPSLLSCSVDDLLGADPDVANREAWEHAKELAGIAEAKFAAVAAAIRWFGVGVLALLVWAALS